METDSTNFTKINRHMKGLGKIYQSRGEGGGRVQTVFSER